MVNSANLEAEKAALLKTIAAQASETASFLGADALDPSVMAAIEAVPREAFVPDTLQTRAYENRPLPIGMDQTISQPYIVAAMTHLLKLPAAARVLEIGTGCGYQTAILAEIAAEVVSVEFIAELADAARARLARLGYDNVAVHQGDGWRGWPDGAPYDGIIVTAAPDRLPTALVDQLRVGARLVIPIGENRRG
ncbi:MAG: protein-L-isoaspartate(D-aspartate) O-methyltransferase [Proteobacteria bacterium]|nr:protein-L-isoaspartate(D-aspartate) O-methyltransferase [Pseudomonadota bacterium]